MYFLILYYSLPGQALVLHCCVSMLLPSQLVPPTQLLVRVLVPPLQVRLQLDHELQALHEPVAADGYEYSIQHIT